MITGLRPATMYKVSIRSWNALGLASEFSQPIEVYTRDEKNVDLQQVLQKVCCVLHFLHNDTRRAVRPLRPW